MAKFGFPDLPVTTEDIPDWEYKMRREMQEIVPNIFLGPYSAATRNKREYLQGHGITHIVCIRHPIEANRIKPNFPESFEKKVLHKTLTSKIRYIVLDIIDSPTELIMKHFPMVKQFIEDGLTRGGKILLHGNGGLSRSAALMIAYLMETYGISYQDAFSYVQQRRYCITPNEGFVRQLVEYEPIYLARYQQRQQEQQIETGNANLKRSYESDEDEPMEDETFKRR